ncbi:MAG: hypothetical protein QXT63_01185 [Thermoplasmata archaeon]
MDTLGIVARVCILATVILLLNATFLAYRRVKSKRLLLMCFAFSIAFVHSLIMICEIFSQIIDDAFTETSSLLMLFGTFFVMVLAMLID